MRVKPWPILLIAFIFTTAPLFNIGISSYLNKVAIIDYLQYIYFNHSLVENLLWILLPIITGFSILRFRTWSYILVLSFIFLISVKFYFDYSQNATMSLALFLGFESINIIIALYFLHPAVRNVYTKPSLRWWEQKPRYLLDQAVMVETKNQVSPGFIKNISVGGLLLQSELPFENNDFFRVNFEIFQKKFSIVCQVIHKGQEGYGVFFTEVKPSQNELNKTVDQMAMQGFPLRTPRPSKSESFKSWTKDLTKGKGIIPRPDTPYSPSAPKQEKVAK